MDGNPYTLVVLQGQTPVEKRLRSLHVEAKPIERGKARVRFIHGAPWIGEVKVAGRSADGVVFDHLSLHRKAGYQDVDPKTVSIEVREYAGKPLAQLQELALQPDTAHTLVLTGTPGHRLHIANVEHRIAGSAYDGDAPGLEGEMALGVGADR